VRPGKLALDPAYFVPARAEPGLGREAVSLVDPEKAVCLVPEAVPGKAVAPDRAVQAPASLGPVPLVAPGKVDPLVGRAVVALVRPGKVADLVVYRDRVVRVWAKVVVLLAALVPTGPGVVQVAWTVFEVAGVH